MNTITIQLPEARMHELQQLAQEANVPAEELLRAGVEEWLSEANGDFRKEAQYVLNKNDDLYRRLT